MINNMKVLVIIPAYNEAENIERVVNNLIENFPQYDYIIVNDIAEKAANKVLTIMEAERYRVARTYFIVDEICKGKKEKQ